VPNSTPIDDAFRGKRALVTGASSGIGNAIARRLAAEGCKLVITARRADRLTALAKDLQKKYQVAIEVFPLDLLEPGAVNRLKRALDDKGLDVDIVVNNAGFGYQEQFIGLEWEKISRLIDLDIRILTEMAHVFARDMVSRGARGHILNVGSIFSYGGVPGYATYSGAKGFVLNFTEALRAELAPRGIQVSMLAPGVTSTEFFDTASNGQVPARVTGIMQTPDDVAKSGIKAIAANRPVVVSGLLYKTMTHLRRILPRYFVVKLWLKAAPKEDLEKLHAPLQE